jgi:4-diphosphocytidyl-2-C-methyl-D-erythritol kinase
MPRIQIEAPAKLNVHLKVGGRRPDGFHDIESLFLALAFGDTLYLETTPSETTPSETATPPEIHMNWQTGGLSPSIPPEKNIISRAISLFRERTGFNEGLKVTVEKRIPPGGGLGGGSSNAAATLLALNRLVSDGMAPVNDAALAEMGASLGSDVPFFLHNAPAAWVTGRGERIQPLELPESVMNLAFVLVNPGFPSDTAEAYRLLDDTRLSSERPHTEDTEFHGGHGGKNLRFSYILNHLTHKARKDTRDSQTTTPCTPCSPCLCEMDSFPDSPPNWTFSNDFLPVLANSDKGTVYQRIIAEMRELGADFAGLSGSGSTCFGVFSGRKSAETAKETLFKRWPFVIVTFLLAR